VEESFRASGALVRGTQTAVIGVIPTPVHRSILGARSHGSGCDPESTKAPYLKQLSTDNDGAAGGPIVADGLVWTIGGDNAVHGLNPANGDAVISIPFGGYANHFPTRLSATACCSSRHRQTLRFHGAGRAATATRQCACRTGIVGSL